jgi:hypothetical protein
MEMTEPGISADIFPGYFMRIIHTINLPLHFTNADFIPQGSRLYF